MANYLISNKGLLLKDEVYCVVGLSFKIWNQLKFGFSEVVYKDAMEVEFIRNSLPYRREAEMSVAYEGIILKHTFKADFILFSELIVEVKACDEGINGGAIQQTLNYLKASSKRVGLIINFGKNRLEYKRLIK